MSESSSRECSLELTQHVQHVRSRCTSMAVWIAAFAGPSTQIQLALASIEKKKGFSLHSRERDSQAPSSFLA